MKQKITLLIVAIFSISLYAQRSCGTEEYMKQKLQDPVFKAQYDASQEAFQREYENLQRSNFKRATIVIPVAVHFINGNASDRTCLENMAKQQVDILNADYRQTNADFSNWATASAQYPGINAGSLDVQFRLATKNHPTGTGLTEGNIAVTVGYIYGQNNQGQTTDSDPKWAGYLNIIVKNLDGGVLGYAPLGGNPSSGDAVVMDDQAFGAGSGCGIFSPNSPYNLGRTTTHEVGHYLNLDHPWASGSCSSDDGVSDTPNIDSSASGCPTPGSIVFCGNKSLTMNYMDYVDDACMYMFTQGQMTRSLAHLNTIRSQFKTNVLSVDSNVFEQSFAILSNPIENELRLSTANNILSENAKMQLFDLAGRSVFKADLNHRLSRQTIDISALKGGLYILKVTSGSNELSKKLIIQ